MQIFMQVLAGARPPVNQVGHLREIQSCQTRWAQLAVVVQIQQIGVCVVVQKQTDHVLTTHLRFLSSRSTTAV